MSNKTPLLVSIGLGLAILSFGEVTLAQENKSTLTTGISATGSISNTVTNINFGGLARRGTGFQFEVIDGTTISIPQDVFESVTTTDADAVTGKSPEEIIVCLTDA